MNEHSAELNPPLDESSFTELLVSQTDSALRRKVRYRPPLATIDEYGCTNETEYYRNHDDIHFMSRINLIRQEFDTRDTTVSEIRRHIQGRVETLYYSANWKSEEMDTSQDGSTYYNMQSSTRKSEPECSFRQTSSVDIEKLLESMSSDISVHSKCDRESDSRTILETESLNSLLEENPSKETDSYKNLLKDWGEFQTYAKNTEDVTDLEINKSSKSLLKYACLKRQNEKQNKEICSGDKEMLDRTITGQELMTQAEIIGSGDITHIAGDVNETIQLQPKPSLICVKNKESILVTDIADDDENEGCESVTYMKRPCSGKSNESAKESVTDSSRCDLTIDLASIQYGVTGHNQFDSISEKTTSVRKRVLRTSSGEDSSVHSSSVSMSSRESLILRNKFQFVTKCPQYYHSSVRQELKTQLNEVPIYTPARQNPITTEMIHTVTNTLYDLKTISQLPIISRDVSNELGLDTEALGAIQGNAFFDPPEAQQSIVSKQILQPKPLVFSESEIDSGPDHPTNKPTLEQRQCLSPTLPKREENTIPQKMVVPPQRIADSTTKKQFLEELSKSIIDSETYFQRCLTELNKCAAKVVQRKEVLKPSPEMLKSAKVEPAPILQTVRPKKEPAHSSIIHATPMSPGKVKEIEQTMKDIDEKRIQPEGKNINRKYREDVTSLIEKLKFLASYRKKVSIRPSRKRKLGKEKIEMLEKSKKQEEQLSSNDFEEVVTQMEFDTGQSPKNQSSAAMQNSVQKVVEWKTHSGVGSPKLEMDTPMDVLKPVRKSIDGGGHSHSLAGADTIKSKEKAKFNKNDSLHIHDYSKLSVKTKKNDLRSHKTNAVVHNTSKNTITTIKSKSSSGKSMVGSACDYKMAICDRKCNLKVKVETKTVEAAKPEKKEPETKIKDSRYKRMLEKVMKYSSKSNDIQATNVIDESTLNMLRDECIKLQQVSHKPGREFPEIKVDDATVAQSLDEETRLLNQITPASVAPFSAEYSKQKHSKLKCTQEKPNKDSENSKKSDIKTTTTEIVPQINAETIKPTNETISLAEVQLLQTLITDPNARFKSTMTIMPVAVKNIYRRPLSKREVAEKPFEHQTISPRKVDFTSIKTAVKSPIRAYIMGTKANATLGGAITTRATIYKDMLQAPEEKTRTRIPKDFEKRPISIHNPIQSTVASLVEGIPALRALSAPKPNINYETVHIPEKPLERNSITRKQLHIAKHNEQINEIIDDILSLSRPEDDALVKDYKDGLHTTPKTISSSFSTNNSQPRNIKYNKQEPKNYDYKEYTYLEPKIEMHQIVRENGSLKPSKQVASEDVDDMICINSKTSGVVTIKRKQVVEFPSGTNLTFSDVSEPNDLLVNSDDSKKESCGTLRLRRSRKINRAVTNLHSAVTDRPPSRIVRDDSVSKKSDPGILSKSTEQLDRNKTKLRPFSSSGSEASLYDGRLSLKRHRKTNKVDPQKVVGLPTVEQLKHKQIVTLDARTPVKPTMPKLNAANNKLIKYRKPMNFESPKMLGSSIELSELPATPLIGNNRNRLANLAKPKSHYVRAHCEEFKTRLGQQFTDRMNRMILKDDKSIFPMNTDSMTNFFRSHTTNMIENVLNALGDVIDTNQNHSDLENKSSSKASTNSITLNSNIPSIMEEDETFENIKSDSKPQEKTIFKTVMNTKSTMPVRSLNALQKQSSPIQLNLEYTKADPLKNLQPGPIRTSMATTKSIQNTLRNIKYSKRPNPRTKKLAIDQPNGQLYFKALYTLRNLGSRATVKSSYTVCKEQKPETTPFHTNSSKELIKLGAKDVQQILAPQTIQILDSEQSFKLGSDENIPIDITKKMSKIIPHDSTTNNSKWMPHIKSSNLLCDNILPKSSDRNNQYTSVIPVNSTHRTQVRSNESINVVRFTLETIFDKVFETISCNWKRRQIADDNFRSVLYEKCSSSTLFKKLEEILLHETEATSSISNISSLLPMVKSSKDINKEKKSLIGIKHNLCCVLPLQSVLVQHVIIYSESVQLHASHLNYLNYVMDSCYLDYAIDDISNCSSASDLWDSGDTNNYWSMHNITSDEDLCDPLTLSGLNASRESVSGFNVPPLIPIEVVPMQRNPTPKKSKLISYRDQFATSSSTSCEMICGGDEHILIDSTNSDKVVEFLKILSDISMTKDYYYLSTIYTKHFVINANVWRIPAEYNVVVMWEKVHHFETNNGNIVRYNVTSENAPASPPKVLTAHVRSQTSALSVCVSTQDRYEDSGISSRLSISSSDTFISVRSETSSSCVNESNIRSERSIPPVAVDMLFQLLEPRDQKLAIRQSYAAWDNANVIKVDPNDKIEEVFTNKTAQILPYQAEHLKGGLFYKDFTLLVLYSLLFLCVFSCLTVQPVCQ